MSNIGSWPKPTCQTPSMSSGPKAQDLGHNVVARSWYGERYHLSLEHTIRLAITDHALQSMMLTADINASEEELIMLKAGQ